MTSKACWHPDSTYIEKTRLYKWMKSLGYEDYDRFFEKSIDDIDWFWREAERELGIHWTAPYNKTVDLSKGLKWPCWYVDGQLNIVESAVSKWAIMEEMREQPALMWEGDDGEIRRFTFHQLDEAISRVASGLKQNGISKGDIVGIYMPMIPETVIAMLAIAKIGAIFSPAFSGYGADAIATRLNAANAKMLITADGFLRRGKRIDMKQEADRAVEMVPSIEKVIVVRRLGSTIDWNEEKDIEWTELERTPPLSQSEKMKTDEPMMLIYTSGTTGKPKGAVHTHSGFPIKSAFDAGVCMDVQRGDRLFWFTDMGWMMGPFLVFGGLVNGASILVYEGTPDYPQPDRLWDVVARHQVTHLGISPTLVRSLMKHGEQWPKKHDLTTLRAIGSTGEPWNPEPWMWLFEKVGHSTVPILNYSGGTEISGGILGNVMIKPISPVTFNSPIPGMAAYVYNENGDSVVGEVGELVLTKPWVGMTNGFWQEPERYEEAYWNRFPDTWVHGDWVIKDEDGFWTITGRSDDILNVAGKRLGPAEMESVLVQHDAVIEAGTIGVPDEVKGEVAVCFVVLHKSAEPTDQLQQELIGLVAEKMGKALKPKKIHFVNDLPKTRNAKVMRRAIKAAYLNKATGDLSSLENPEAVEAIKLLGNKELNV